MGCQNAKAQTYPLLLCFYELGNEEQKNYCIQLKDNIKHSKPIKFEIKASPGVPFAIKFEIKKKIYDIQTTLNYGEDIMNKSLEQIYKLLDEN